MKRLVSNKKKGKRGKKGKEEKGRDELVTTAIHYPVHPSILPSILPSIHPSLSPDFIQENMSTPSPSVLLALRYDFAHSPGSNLPPLDRRHKYSSMPSIASSMRDQNEY